MEQLDFKEKMKVIIHRGQHQIGGSIIEIKTDTTKIIFDIGINLDENTKFEYPVIEGLFTGKKERHEWLNMFGKAKISKYTIAKEKYIMCIRPSMINYLKRLNELQEFEDGILFYGMWKGYQEKEDMASLLEYMKEQGVRLHTLHTSGHADTKTIEQLIADVNPKVIMPVHTENESWFDIYKDKISVIYENIEIEI